MRKSIIIVLLLFVYLKTYEQAIEVELIRPKTNKELREELLKQHTTKVILAIMRQESNDGKELYSSAVWENAVGILQIRPVMLNEVNNILGFKKYVLNDRLDSLKSIEMFMVFQKKYNPNMDLEQAARKWNGGDRGMNKSTTIAYYKIIKRNYESLN